MNFMENVRQVAKEMIRAARLKAERVQARFFSPREVPMCTERIQDRAARLPKGWDLVVAPVAIRYRRTFKSFRHGVEFLSDTVVQQAEKQGFAPDVEIRGSEVFVTLGVEAPPILSEGDFDFAQAIGEPANDPDEAGLVHKPREAA